MTPPTKPRRKSGPSGPQSRACPRCGVVAGVRCRTPSGAAALVHVERRENRPRGSGPDVESSRRRGQVLLRLDSADRAALDGLATRWGVTRSAAVARLVYEAAVNSR